jgi:hypothetical protein
MDMQAISLKKYLIIAREELLPPTKINILSLNLEEDVSRNQPKDGPSW